MKNFLPLLFIVSVIGAARATIRPRFKIWGKRMRKFLFVITAIAFPTVSFSDIASTAYVDKTMGIVATLIVPTLSNTQPSINPTEKCDFVCADDTCSDYELDCTPIPDEERAYNTFVIIDKYGNAKPSEIQDDGNGEFITDICVRKIM